MLGAFWVSFLWSVYACVVWGFSWWRLDCVGGLLPAMMEAHLEGAVSRLFLLGICGRFSQATGRTFRSLIKRSDMFLAASWWTFGFSYSQCVSLMASCVDVLNNHLSSLVCHGLMAVRCVLLSSGNRTSAGKAPIKGLS